MVLPFVRSFTDLYDSDGRDSDGRFRRRIRSFFARRYLVVLGRYRGFC